MFSPAEPTIVAVGGIGGTRILDIRFDPVRYINRYNCFIISYHLNPYPLPLKMGTEKCKSTHFRVTTLKNNRRYFISIVLFKWVDKK